MQKKTQMEEEEDRRTPLLDDTPNARHHHDCTEETDEESGGVGSTHASLATTGAAANDAQARSSSSPPPLIPSITSSFRARLLPSHLHGPFTSRGGGGGENNASSSSRSSTSTSTSTTTSSSRRKSRLVERHATRTGQAKGSRWNMTRVGWGDGIQDSLESLLYDSFNTLLMAPTGYTLAFLACAYLSLVMLFAGVYVVLSKQEECNMDIDSFLKGYLFSLETMVRREGGRRGRGREGWWNPTLTNRSSAR